MWYLVIFGLCLGLVGGYVFGQRSNKESKELREKSEALMHSREELSAYHDKVNQHFIGTADLLKKMNEDYKAVYQHLASGSEVLCDVNVSKIAFKSESELETVSEEETLTDDELEIAAEGDTLQPEVMQKDAKVLNNEEEEVKPAA